MSVSDVSIRVERKRNVSARVKFFSMSHLSALRIKDFLHLLTGDTNIHTSHQTPSVSVGACFLETNSEAAVT